MNASHTHLGVTLHGVTRLGVTLIGVTRNGVTLRSVTQDRVTHKCVAGETDPHPRVGEGGPVSHCTAFHALDYPIFETNIPRGKPFHCEVGVGAP